MTPKTSRFVDDEISLQNTHTFFIQISHEGNHHMEQRPLVGVKFLNLSRADIAVSAYESNEIIILRA